jgi:hypothetical protein
MNSKRQKRLQWLVLIGLLASAGLYAGCGIYMPGKSFSGALPPINEAQQSVADNLLRIVTTLAEEHINRNTATPHKLEAAANYVQQEFEQLGYNIERQTFDVDGVACHNLITEIKGSGDEILVLAAHYDAVPNCPGANDNASGVAALLSLAKYFKGKQTDKTVRFVAFTNEEPPHFRQDSMGSLVYANRCRANNDNITAMFSLETMAFYSDEANSQNYPPVVSWLYPSTGDFVGIIGNKKSRKLATRTIKRFREEVEFPSEAAAISERITGVGFSDHWSFWRNGYPGLMITDTAFFRYAHYHKPSDTPDKLNFERFARVVEGLHRVFEMEAGESTK